MKVTKRTADWIVTLVSIKGYNNYTSGSQQKILVPELGGSSRANVFLSHSVTQFFISVSLLAWAFTLYAGRTISLREI